MMRSKVLAAVLLILIFSPGLRAQYSGQPAASNPTVSPAPSDGSAQDRPTRLSREAVAEYATSLGYDLSTEAGRKQFGDFARNKVESIAKEQNIDLTTKDGKKQLAQYLSSNGQAALLPPPRGDRPQARNQAGQQDQSSQASQPPCEHDQQGQSSSAASANTGIAAQNINRPAGGRRH